MLRRVILSNNALLIRFILYSNTIAKGENIAGGFREPIGEPRVTRNREPAQRAQQRPTDVDVPEFMPRF